MTWHQDSLGWVIFITCDVLFYFTILADKAGRMTVIDFWNELELLWLAFNLFS